MSLTLTNGDIVQTLEFLAEGILKAQGGTVNTIVSNDLADIGDVSGYKVLFLSADFFGEERAIISVDEEASILTLDSDMSSSITNTTKFAYIETGFQSFVKRAEAIIISLFRNKGMNINLFLNDAQLKEIHIYKTIELICLSKRQDANSDDMYHSNYESFRDMFDSSFSNLVADYDYDEDGSIDDDEEGIKIGQVSFLR